MKSSPAERDGKSMENEELKEGEDFYFDEGGLLVFTASYLMKRGTCCESGCRHCPYGFKKENPPLKKGDEGDS